jgi:catechol 2,3-dioxygenase-like lactoylglutathione lyase family enzyme
MLSFSSFDHVDITAANLAEACNFYAEILGDQVILEHGVGRDASLRQVARNPTMVAADICLRRTLALPTLLDKLGALGVEVVEGPTPRRMAGRKPSRSVYFRDPDGNPLGLIVPE